MGRDGDVHVRRRGATSAEEALVQLRRYRKYHLSWRQLRVGARLCTRQQIRAAIRATWGPLHCAVRCEVSVKMMKQTPETPIPTSGGALPQGTS